MAHFYENLKTVEDYHASKGIEEERYTVEAKASEGADADDKAKGAEASKADDKAKGAEAAKASEAVTADDVKDLVNAAMEGLTDKIKSDILSATKIMSTDEGAEDGSAGGDEKKEE
jgi:hypothetical protein